MRAETEKYKALQIEALKKERQRLLDKGVPMHAPRAMKLANMIKRLYRQLGQGELFDKRGAAARSGGGGSGGDSTAATDAQVSTAKRL